MNMNKISKRLSWLLRHCQEPLYIDPQGGWAPVETILQALSKKNRTVDRQMLETIVATDEKGRYSFDASGDRIRANQGHSIPGVIIEMEKPVPPEYLYHGTAGDFLPSIMEKGLLPMSRQYVHISPDYETAVRVGTRHGRNHGGTAILEFAAGDFVRDGHDLWISANGIWQAKIVPPQYLQVRVEFCEKQIPAETEMRLTEALTSESASVDSVSADPVSADPVSVDPVSPDSVSPDSVTIDSVSTGPAPAPVPGGRRKTDHYAIPCKYCMPVLRDKPLKGIILGIHGFSGSKESTGLHVLAKKVVPEGYGIVCFDLPAHWKSPAAPEMLTVENAMRDILFMAEECRREFPDLPKYIFATSFGAYLTLLCCKESSCLIAGGDKGDKSLTVAGGDQGDKSLTTAGGDQGGKSLMTAGGQKDLNPAGGELADYHIILRAPAVTMPEVFLNLLNMTAEEFRTKAPLDCTNDPARPLPVYYSFYESLIQHSVFDAGKETYPPMLVMHGDADEVVPPRDVHRFCDQFPQMDLHVIPGCDHGFTAPGAHEEMCRLAMDFLQENR